MWLLLLFSLFKGTNGLTYQYQLSVENSDACSCNPTGAYTGTNSTTQCIAVSDDFPTIVPGLNVGFNISYTTGIGWQFTTYGPGTNNPCGTSVLTGKGDFNCLNCGTYLNKFFRTSTNSWWVICLMQINCNFGPQPLVPTDQPIIEPTKSTNPSVPNGVTHEHYEKTTTKEEYDRTSGGTSVQPSVNVNLNENWGNYFAHRAQNAPSTNSWSAATMLLFFLTVLVSLVVGGFAYKRMAKRAQYEPVPDSVDPDSLLYTSTEKN